MGSSSSKSKSGKKRSWFVRVIRFVFFCHLAFWIVIAFLTILYNFINPPITPLILQRYLVRGYDWHKRSFIRLENIPPTTIRMVIALEDGNYYKHFGFEFSEVKTAWKRNKKSGKIRYGASTISNQLARTIFLTTDRNYFRKYLEIQATVIMETLMSKDRKLELYMNYVEWGKGIYGIETASRFYYNRSCTKICRDQAKKLVSVISSPIKYNPHNFYQSASARQRYRMLNRYF